jgi:putative transposase
MRFAFIGAEKARVPVSTLCRVLEVSRSGFYAWQGRPASARSRRDVQLTSLIRISHAESRGTYGSPRISRDLQARSIRVSRKRVARLMGQAGLIGRRPRRYRVTTDSKHCLPVASNLVKRRFKAEAPNQLWVTDITYIHTWEGWLYLAVVLDVFSRRVVGYALAEHLRTQLVLEALQRALDLRQPKPGLVHHSDRGCQYASDAYRGELAERGITCSMSRLGDCWDNAVAESFFSTLKRELVSKHPWPTRQLAKEAIDDYIAGFYNPQRRHSALGYRSPIDFERRQSRSKDSAA